MFFFDRDLRQFEPRNCNCISNNMNFHSLVLNLRRFLFSGKIQRFESINNYILLHFCLVKSEMRSNLTSRLSQRFMVAPATRRGSGKASESLLARTINNFVQKISNNFLLLNIQNDVEHVSPYESILKKLCKLIQIFLSNLNFSFILCQNRLTVEKTS